MDSNPIASSSSFRLAGSRRFGVFLVFASLGTLPVTSCHRADGSVPGVTVIEQISPQPPQVGPTTVTVELTDAAQKPIANANIMVEADMSHPGMSPLFGQASQTVPGTYRAHVNFNMGGDWIVLLHIKLPDGRKIERQVDVRGVQLN